MQGIGFRFCVLLIAVLSIGVLAHGQSDRATITGTVSDQSGAVLPGAALTVTNSDTGAAFITVTNANGVYTLPSLPVGVYTLKVTSTGFKSYVRTGLSPVADQVITANVSMTVGTASESVTVSGTPALEVQTATEAMTMESTAIEELPLNAGGGRNAINLLIATSPNVTQATINSTGTQNWVSFSGGETFSNSIFIDGTNATAGNQGMAITPGQDALQEMQLQTNVTDAELAGTGGGAIVYVLKSGANQFHGSAFEYLQNEDLNANSWAQNQFLSQCASGDTACRAAHSRQKFRFNDFGGSAGGPIWKNHTFVFGDFEYYKQSDYRENPTGMTVPTAQLLSGDLSPLLTQGTKQGNIINPKTNTPWINPCTGQPYLYGQVFDPTTWTTVNGQTCATPFNNNQIPAGRISSVSQKVAAAFNQYYKPVINQLQGGNFPTLVNGQPEFWKKTFDVKLDHYFSDRHHVSASFDWQSDNSSSVQGPFYYDKGPFASVWDFADKSDKMLRVVDNYSFKPTLINSFSVAWNLNPSEQTPINHIDPTTYGFTTGVGVFPYVGFGNNVNGIGYSYLGANWDLYMNLDSYNYADTVAWQAGRHSMKFGVQWTAQQLNSATNTLNEQAYKFQSDTGSPTDPGLTPYVGSGLSAFLLGDVNLGVLTQRNGYYPRQKYLALFTEDDFKVNPKLTVNLGLRWDLTLPGHMASGKWENFDINVTNPNWAPYNGAWVFSQNSGTTFENYVPLYQFGPHLGAAYQVTHKLVARASYGLSYVPLSALTSGGADNYPANQDPLAVGSNRVQTSVEGAYTFNWDGGYPGQTISPPQNSTATSFGDATSMMYINPNMLKLGRINSFYAGFQYELARNVVLDTRYLGTFGNGLHDYGRGTDVSWPTNWSQYNAVLQAGRINTQISSAADAAAVSAASGVTVPYPYAGFSGPARAAIAPYPQVATLGYKVQLVGDPMDNASSAYNSFVAELKVRNTHGLYVDWSYTISKYTSDSTSVTSGALSNFSNNWSSDQQSPNDYQSWPVANDRRQVAKGYFTYDLPFGAHHLWLNQSSMLNYFVGGWTLGYYGAYGSGLPMGRIISPYQLPYYYSGQQRANFANGANGSTMKNNFQGHLSLINKTAASNYDFDRSAFSPTTATAPFGNTPVYFNHWRWNTYPAQENISIVKRFGIGHEGRYQAQVRAEFYNALNRHYYNPPDRNMNDSTFGDVTGIASSGRVGQVAARFEW